MDTQLCARSYPSPPLPYELYGSRLIKHQAFIASFLYARHAKPIPDMPGETLLAADSNGIGPRIRANARDHELRTRSTPRPLF